MSFENITEGATSLYRYSNKIEGRILKLSVILPVEMNNGYRGGAAHGIWVLECWHGMVYCNPL